MRKDMVVGLRTWVLCAASAGLFSQSITAGELKPVVSPTAKKPAAKPVPAQSAQPPKLLMVADETSSTANAVVPASQIEIAANDKTEVQRQLELLYEKDGKEMPDMQLKLVPLNPPGKTPAAAPQAAPASAPRPTQPPAAQKPAKPIPGYTKYQPVALARPQTTNFPTPVTPVTSQSTKNYAAAFDAQGPQSVQPQQQAQAQAQPRQNPVSGFFKKLIPGARKPLTSQPPVPPDYANNSVPDVPPASQGMQSNQYLASQPKGPLPPVTNNVQLAAKPVLLPAPLNAEPIPLSPVAPKAPIAVGYSSNSVDLPQPDGGLPALAQLPMSLPDNPGEAFMPPLMNETLPLPAVVLNTKPEELVYELPKPQTQNDFPNPFPELPESQADLKGKALPNVAQVPAVQVPKVPTTAVPALTAQIPSQQVPTLPIPSTDLATSKEPETSVATLEPPKTDEDPYAVRVKDFAEPRIDEKVEANAPSLALTPSSPDVIAPPGPLTTPSQTDTKADVGPALDVGALSQEPADALSPADPSDSYLEKMQRIRDRFGMKGLKGFCPVTLRDERELLDAKPEFHFTHRSQKFHFASQEACDRFEADPSVYAPAAYGADVVSLGRDKDVVEGTLDFAAWYKGRLYLFSTQDNYEVFVKSPVTYASPAGVD